jgi:hypothetical protein
VVAEGDRDAARLTLQDAQALIHVVSLYSESGVVAPRQFLSYLRPEIPNQLLATSNLMRDGCCLLQLDWRLPFNFFGPMPCFLKASH